MAHTQLRCRRILLLLGLLSGLFQAGVGAGPSTASPAYTAGLRGEVRASQSGAPLSGARVTVPELELDTLTDASGRFSWPAIPIPQPVLPVTVRISAPGYGEWDLHNLPLAADDTLILTPELQEFPVQQVMPLPGEYSRSPEMRMNTGQFIEYLAKQLEQWELPEQIRVRMTGKWQCDPDAPYRVVTVDFKEYVKHVLPHEWYYFWPRESLKAGALAVKMYAWYFIQQGGKWADADVFDSTCDQWYQPYVSRESTNRAVDETWPWMLTRQGRLFPTYHKDIEACDPPACMRQSVSAQLATEGLTWDRILDAFYPGSELTALSLPPAGFALRFNGTGSDGMGANRLQIPVGELEGERGNPVNVGAGDFTVEWWMKAYAQENNAPALECGRQASWASGNIILDRSRPDKNPGFGVSIAGGLPVFGVTGPNGQSLTLCGRTPITDGRWHHIAVQRQAADGRLWLFVDGQLDADGQGPPGDISYPAGYGSAYPDREPFLSLGGWKQGPDHFRHPFFRGMIDEVRFSGRLRYRELFTPPQGVFTTDEDTLALYHLDEGLGKVAQDSSGASGGPAGFLLFGGAIPGPEWVPSSLFIDAWTIYLPSINLQRGQ